MQSVLDYGSSALTNFPFFTIALARCLQSFHGMHAQMSSGAGKSAFLIWVVGGAEFITAVIFFSTKLTIPVLPTGHFHIKLEVQKMQFLGLISSQNKIYCSILHLHSKHMVVFYKR